MRRQVSIAYCCVPLDLNPPRLGGSLWTVATAGLLGAPGYSSESPFDELTRGSLPRLSKPNLPCSVGLEFAINPTFGAIMENTSI